MGYPYGKTYLEQIKEGKSECEAIYNAYYVLAHKYAKDHQKDPTELTLKESFGILGEAFELASDILDGCTDEYHFMWDVLDELLTPKVEKEV